MTFNERLSICFQATHWIENEQFAEQMDNLVATVLRQVVQNGNVRAAAALPQHVLPRGFTGGFHVLESRSSKNVENKLQLTAKETTTKMYPCIS